MSGVMDWWILDAGPAMRWPTPQSAIQQFAKLRYCLAAERRARVPASVPPSGLSARSQNLKSKRPKLVNRLLLERAKLNVFCTIAGTNYPSWSQPLMVWPVPVIEKQTAKKKPVQNRYGEFLVDGCAVMAGKAAKVGRRIVRCVNPTRGNQQTRRLSRTGERDRCKMHRRNIRIGFGWNGAGAETELRDAAPDA
jgi:hypothetical protein